ncbi:MAG: hypothetical protein O8C64_00320 [Candidatus Methanoperedens sp.]|nr:hypothetical protein [Candidatus Methanoperedens sp.]MCZ7405626.1 hypothetical protein [Candidatus Methanoperedens sp.]
MYTPSRSQKRVEDRRDSGRLYLRFVISIRIACIGFYRRAEQLKLFNSEFVRVPCAANPAHMRDKPEEILKEISLRK